MEGQLRVVEGREVGRTRCRGLGEKNYMEWEEEREVGRKGSGVLEGRTTGSRGWEGGTNGCGGMGGREGGLGVGG